MLQRIPFIYILKIINRIIIFININLLKTAISHPGNVLGRNFTSEIEVDIKLILLTEGI